jgi:hypothetical protein
LSAEQSGAPTEALRGRETERVADPAGRTRRPWIVGAATVLLLLVLGSGVLGVDLRPPTLFGGVEAVGYANGSFYVRVEPNRSIGARWLASSDGGRTWTHALQPFGLVAAAKVASETWSACADDGVCYRARMDYPAGYPKVDSRHLVERGSGGSDWVVEADLPTAPALIGLAVNPADSTQAVAISWGYAFYRDPARGWQVLDLAAQGSDPLPVQWVIGWIGSRTMTIALLLVLSVLGWLRLPSLQAKWVTQLVNLVVFGFLQLVAMFSLGIGVFWPNLVWAVVTVAVVRRVRRGALRRAAAASPATVPTPSPPTGFDPPSGAR